MGWKDVTVQNGNRTFTMPVNGLDPAVQEIWALEMAKGRFIDDADNERHALVAAIGSEAKDKLFSGMGAVGDDIRVNGVEFQVVGVVKPRMQEGDDDDNRTIYIPYNSLDVIKDTHYVDGLWMDSVGLDHDKLDRTIREMCIRDRSEGEERGVRLGEDYFYEGDGSSPPKKKPATTRSPNSSTNKMCIRDRNCTPSIR